MKSSPIRIFLLLGLISITGALITQLFWLQKAMVEKGNNFDDNVILSLRRVAEHLDVSSTNSIITLEVVRKVSESDRPARKAQGDLDRLKAVQASRVSTSRTQ